MEGSYQISYAQNAAIHSELAFQMIYCLVPWLTGSTVLQQRLLRHGGASVASLQMRLQLFRLDRVKSKLAVDSSQHFTRAVSSDSINVCYVHIPRLHIAVEWLGILHQNMEYKSDESL